MICEWCILQLHLSKQRLHTLFTLDILVSANVQFCSSVFRPFVVEDNSSRWWWIVIPRLIVHVQSGFEGLALAIFSSILFMSCKSWRLNLTNWEIATPLFWKQSAEFNKIYLVRNYMAESCGHRSYFWTSKSFLSWPGVAGVVDSANATFVLFLAALAALYLTLAATLEFWHKE